MRFARDLALFALLLPSLPALAQPKIELPPEDPRSAIPKPAAIDLPRESQIGVPLDDHPMSGTALGGYGEIVLNAPDDTQPTTIDVRRLVLYVGHNFTEKLRFYGELEMEHAVTSSTDRGETEVEQAFIDYLAYRWLNLRAGLIIMPVGIVNQEHEPPTFNGADRPDTDLYIIPTTWREVGAGVFGAIGPFRYQLYGVTGFDAHRFSADGLSEGHQEGQFARAHSWAGVARLDCLPFAGADIGVSGYVGGAGQGDAAIGAAPVTLVEADARLRWKGLEVRAEFANVWVGNTTQLNAELYPDGGGGAFVARQMRGGYGEVGYDVLRPWKSKLKYASSLVAFGRYERTDTQAEVVGHDRAAGHDREATTGGLNFRPIAELALKLDYQRRSIDVEGAPRHGWNQVNLGLGWMF